MICDTVKLTHYISDMLKINPDLFSDNEPLSEEFIEQFKNHYAY